MQQQQKQAVAAAGAASPTPKRNRPTDVKGCRAALILAFETRDPHSLAFALADTFRALDDGSETGSVARRTLVEALTAVQDPAPVVWAALSFSSSTPPPSLFATSSSIPVSPSSSPSPSSSAAASSSSPSKLGGLTPPSFPHAHVIATLSSAGLVDPVLHWNMIEGVLPFTSVEGYKALVNAVETARPRSSKAGISSPSSSFSLPASPSTLPPLFSPTARLGFVLSLCRRRAVKEAWRFFTSSEGEDLILAAATDSSASSMSERIDVSVLAAVLNTSPSSSENAAFYLSFGAVFFSFISCAQWSLGRHVASTHIPLQRLLIAVASGAREIKIAVKLLKDYGFSPSEFPLLYKDVVFQCIHSFLHMQASDLIASRYWDEDQLNREAVREAVAGLVTFYREKKRTATVEAVRSFWRALNKACGHQCGSPLSYSIAQCSCRTIRVEMEGAAAVTTTAASSQRYHSVWADDGAHLPELTSAIAALSGGSSQSPSPRPGAAAGQGPSYTKLASDTVLVMVDTVEGVEEAAMGVHLHAKRVREAASGKGSGSGGRSPGGGGGGGGAGGASRSAASPTSSFSPSFDVEVGLDAEWLCPLSILEDPAVALLQVAHNGGAEGRDAVYLFDIPTLAKDAVAAGVAAQERLDEAFAALLAPRSWLCPPPSSKSEALLPPTVNVLTFGGVIDLTAVAKSHPFLTVFTCQPSQQQPGAGSGGSNAYSSSLSGSTSFTPPGGGGGDASSSASKRQNVPIRGVDLAKIAKERELPLLPGEAVVKSSNTSGGSPAGGGGAERGVGAAPSPPPRSWKKPEDDIVASDVAGIAASEPVTPSKAPAAGGGSAATPSSPAGTPSAAAAAAAAVAAASSSTSSLSLPGGLALLVWRTLGAPLDKTNQMSDWTRRPLYSSQQKYAALDAWVLPKVYSVLLSCPRKKVGGDGAGGAGGRGEGNTAGAASPSSSAKKKKNGGKK